MSTARIRTVPPCGMTRRTEAKANSVTLPACLSYPRPAGLPRFLFDLVASWPYRFMSANNHSCSSRIALLVRSVGYVGGAFQTPHFEEVLRPPELGPMHAGTSHPKVPACRQQR